MPKKLRNLAISLFVILWLLVFNYESLRYFYLNPIVGRPLPKVKLLFPPAGWIMFYNVDDRFAYTEVYGVKNGIPQFIDPHQILVTRTIGYDNIHRNVLSTILSRRYERSFCEALQKKFPYFDEFVITVVEYPSLTKEPFKRYQELVYRCGVRSNP